MKKASESVDDSEEDEADDDDDEDEDSDEGSVTPTPASVAKKPAAAAVDRPLAMKGISVKSALAPKQPPPTPSGPFRGWYSSVWDPELFDQQVPMLYDVVEVALRLSDGSEGAGVVARVEYLEPTDHYGSTAVLKYVDGNDNFMSDWAKDFMLGGEVVDGGLIHFCRSWPCHAVCDEKTLVHCTRWKLLPPKPPVPGPSTGGGLQLFGGASKDKMSAVDAARSEANVDAAAARRSAGGGQRAALPPGNKPFPPLPPPSVVPRASLGGKGNEHPAPSQRGKPSMDTQLRERAARVKPRDNAIDLERERSRGRRKKKDKRRDRSCSSSDSSSKPVFRGAPTIFKGSKFLQTAVTQEGALLENGVLMMRKALAARQGGGGLTSETIEQLTTLQGVVTNYLTVGLGPSAASQGKPLGMRNEREMRTLAESLDALLNGDLGRAGDIMMQRFRACEVNAIEGDWGMAKHLELIPAHQISSIPNGMRQEMQKEKRLADKLAAGSSSNQRKGGRDQGG